MAKETIKRRLTESLATVQEMRSCVSLAVVVFFSGIMIGVASPELFSFLFESFRELVEPFQDRSVPVLIVMIFSQNCGAALMSVLMGILFGIVPFISAAMNGILLGLMVTLFNKSGTLGLLIALVPHGIFEFPAMFLSWGLGMWLGTWLFRRKKEETFGERAKKAFHVFLTLVFPLLVTAAIIEGLLIAFLQRP